MEHMLPSPGFSIPSIGTPIHQPEADQMINLSAANAVYQQQMQINQHGACLVQQNSHSTLTNVFGSPPRTVNNSSIISSSVQYNASSPKHIQSYLPTFNTPQSLMPPQTPQSFMSPMVPMQERSSNEVINNIHQTMGPATPMTPMTPSSVDSGIVPQLQNIVSTVNLSCKLDLKKIALHARNAEYNPKRFAAVIMRIREPRTTALIFSSGKMVCTGAKSEDDSRLAARKYARIIQKLGFSAKFLDFKIQNMVGSCDVKFPIRLEGLVLTHATFSSYEPELFPGLIYRMVKPRIVLLIFVSGKVVLTGAKVRQEIYEAFDKIFPILKSFKKQ
ncbi:uncharacterized protein LOC129606083 [Condylostylus longicornis]|uniref:uncharacterized protein LOC129606083 n=1 Tax=Condylostylus longicornis TaxID=2530218 RepID=UPI00244E24D9|nr:uncharacterized protein LOC129606083 [Condylostylus longicornis]